MKETQDHKNKIIAGGVIATLLFIVIFSKAITKTGELKKPHEIENIIQFSALPTTKECALLIGFGSFKGGIDQHIHRKVVQYLRHHNSITSIQSYANGAEGAHLLCVKTKETADNKALYKAVRKMLPAFSNKGFSSLEMDGVKKFQTKWK